MIGFTSTTFRKLSCTQVADVAKSIGAECIEWGGDVHVRTVEDALRVKALCQEAGVVICSYGSYYRLGKSTDGRRICEIAHAMGARAVRIWFGVKGSKRTTQAEFEAMVADGKALSAIASEYGLTICGECHANTYNDTADTCLRLLKAVNAPNFRTYFQSRYQHLAADYKRLEATFDYVENFHFSYKERVRMQAFWRKERRSIPTIIAMLEKRGFSGNYLLEYTYFSSPKYAKKDISRFLREWEQAKIK